MTKRVTIALDAGILRWARENAQPENISMSSRVSRLLQRQKASDYWRAYDKWKRLPGDWGASIDASQRFTRDEAYERR